jgi:hypothetical protein
MSHRNFGIGFGMDSKPPPKKCFCGSKLSEPIYKKQWRVSCNDCRTTYIWCHPGVWRERSSLPLFDTRKILK